MKIFRNFLIAALTLMAFGAHAQDNSKAQIKQIEDYFNKLKTMQATFVQFNQDGSLARGKFFLARPKFRFDYEVPTDLYVISDGKDIRSYEKGERSDPIPLNATPAFLIMGEQLRLNGDITVTSLIPLTGELSVTMVNTNDPDAGSLTLIFKESPFELIRWVVNDIQGNTTQVALHNIVYDENLPPQLFHLNKRPRKLYKLPNTQKG